MDALSYVIYEPTSSNIAESYEIYQDMYDEAYANAGFVDEELTIFLIEHDIWNPLLDKEVERILKEIDNKKVEAYENYYRKELSRIKREIRFLERKYTELQERKTKFNFLTCHHFAESCRLEWLFSTNCYCGDKLVDDPVISQSLFGIYTSQILKHDDIRNCSKLDIWRTIWFNNKIHGGQLFNKNPIDFTRDQLSLCSFSQMYDNVYENPEKPVDKIIEDNDCLDGWFIFQKRKAEEEKPKDEKFATNPKIANAQERFFMAANPEEARVIFEMNDAATRQKLTQRFEYVSNSNEKVKEVDLPDRKMQLNIEANRKMVERMRGK